MRMSVSTALLFAAGVSVGVGAASSWVCMAPAPMLESFPGPTAALGSWVKPPPSDDAALNRLIGRAMTTLKSTAATGTYCFMGENIVGPLAIGVACPDGTWMPITHRAAP